MPWKRPIATTTGIMVIIAMALLTYKGGRRLAQRDRTRHLAAIREEQAIVAESGCLACHAIGEKGPTAVSVRT